MRLSNQGRRYPHVFLGRNPHEKPLMPEGDRIALEINTEHAELERFSADRLSKRHIKEVCEYLVLLRKCRRQKKRTPSAPKDIHETIYALRLVV